MLYSRGNILKPIPATTVKTQAVATTLSNATTPSSTKATDSIPSIDALSGTREPSSSREANIIATHSQLLRSAYGVEEHLLSSGLRLVIIPNESQLLKASLIVHSGSNEDPEGKKGLAHFLEHLCAGHATGNFAKEEILDTCRIFGGDMGASTSGFSTQYNLELPIERKELALQILMAILHDARFDTEGITNEKAVIINEMNDSSGATNVAESQRFQYFYGSKDPRAHPIIGYEENVESLNYNDLREYYDTHYHDGNATLVLSGNITRNEALRLAGQYSNNQKPRQQIKKNSLDTELLTQSRNKTITIEDPQGSCLSVLFHLPGQTTKENKTAKYLSPILHERLEERIAKNESLACKLDEIYIDILQERNMACLEINIACNGYTSVEDLKTIRRYIIQTLKDIARNGLTDIELDNAIKVNQITGSEIATEVHGKYDLVVNHYSCEQDWKESLDDFNRFIPQQTDFQHLATTWLDEKKALTAYTISKAHRNSLGTKRPKDRHLPELDFAQYRLRVPQCIKGSVDIDEIKPHCSATEYSKGPDGTTIRFRRNGNDQRIKIRLSHRGGDSLCDHEHPVLNMITAELASQAGYIQEKKHKKGTQHISTEEFSQEKKSNRVYAYYYSTNNKHGLYLEYPTDSEEASIRYFTKILEQPGILYAPRKALEDLLENVKIDIIQGVESIEDDITGQAGIKLSQVLFPEGHPLRLLDAKELKQALDRISLEDVQNHFRRYFKFTNSDINILGHASQDLIKERIIPLLQTLSHNTDGDSSSTNQLHEEISITDLAPQDIKLNKQNHTQHLLMGCAWQMDGDTKEIGRLCQLITEIIDTKLYKLLTRGLGLCYTPSFEIEKRDIDKIGYSYIELDSNRIAEAREITKRFFEHLVEHGIDEEELAYAKLQLLHSKKNTLETYDHSLDFDLPRERSFDELKDWLKQLKLAQVNEAIKVLIRPDKMSYILSS